MWPANQELLADQAIDALQDAEGEPKVG